MARASQASCCADFLRGLAEIDDAGSAEAGRPVARSCRSQRRMDSRIKGISRGSRPILRHQPQLRLDCSPAIMPFSQSATDTPRLGKGERGRGADDAAADDDDIGFSRQLCCSADGIDAG